MNGQRVNRRDLVLLSLVAGLGPAVVACQPGATPSPTAAPPKSPPTSAPTTAAPAPTAGQAATPAAKPTPAFAGAKVVMDANPIITTLSWIVAQDQGFFKQEGIDFDLQLSFQPSVQAIQRLAGGSQTISVTNPSAALNNAIVRGAGILVVGASQVTSKLSGGSKLLVSTDLYNQGVRSTKDLKGMEINIPFGLDSGFGRWMVLIFRHFGLDPMNDVKITGWGNQGDLQAGLIAGSVKVGTVGEPGATIALKSGAVKAIDDSAIETVLDGEVSTMILMSREFVERNSEATIRVLKARQRAVVMYDEARQSKWQRNPAVKKAMVERLKLSEDIISEMSGNWFPPSGLFDVERAKAAFSFYQEIGTIKELVPLDTYLDFKYMKEAVARLKAEGVQIPPDPYVKQ